MQAILDHSGPLPVSELRSAARYKAMYRKLTDKTRRRDLNKLKELQLIWQTESGRLWSGFAKPDEIIIGGHPAGGAATGAGKLRQ